MILYYLFFVQNEVWNVSHIRKYFMKCFSHTKNILWNVSQFCFCASCITYFHIWNVKCQLSERPADRKILCWEIRTWFFILNICNFIWYLFLRSKWSLKCFSHMKIFYEMFLTYENILWNVSHTRKYFIISKNARLTHNPIKLFFRMWEIFFSNSKLNLS
jgi:hypothetical protein